MRTVAIAGVGLIGGSFALAIRAAGFSGNILGISSPSTIREALDLGVIDEGVTLEHACAEADLLYLAQPILRIIDLFPRIGPLLRPGILVTDAGSTKGAIAEAARRHLPAGSFLGGHPMAGKETRGVACAEAGLFAGRPYVLTPEGPALEEPGPAADFVQMITSIGARPVLLTPEQHDQLVAYTSHLPQLISTALGLALSGKPSIAGVSGPAILDFTRLSSSPYDMWADIFETNAANVRSAVLSFIEILGGLAGRLESGLESEFQASAQVGDAIRNNRA